MNLPFFKQILLLHIIQVIGIGQREHLALYPIQLEILWPVSMTQQISLASLILSMHTAGAFLAQLPTSVAQYLGAFVWEPKWGNIGNTVVHNADAGDFSFDLTFQYLENCTETWTYDATYGAWIGYKIQDNETNTIYEFSIELPTAAEIPGFEIPILLGVSMGMSVILIFVIMKKRK